MSRSCELIIIAKNTLQYHYYLGTGKVFDDMRALQIIPSLSSSSYANSVSTFSINMEKLLTSLLTHTIALTDNEDEGLLDALHHFSTTTAKAFLWVR